VFDRDAPDGVKYSQKERGRIVLLKHAGGLHHEYFRMAV